MNRREFLAAAAAAPIALRAGGVRTLALVTADLDHRRRDEDVQLVRLEPRHQLAALGRPQASVQQADAVAPELRATQPLGLRLGRAGLARLGLLDQRTDDVRLPPRVEVLA